MGPDRMEDTTTKAGPFHTGKRPSAAASVSSETRPPSGSPRMWRYLSGMPINKEKKKVPSMAYLRVDRRGERCLVCGSKVKVSMSNPASPEYNEGRHA